jgi:hypothetical protein
MHSVVFHFGRCVLPWFIGAFANLRKATISFIVSVRPSVRIEQLGSHWRDFLQIWYLSIFRKSAEKIQISLKSYKNNGYFTWIPIHFWSYLIHFLKWEIFHKNVVQKIKTTHILCLITFFLENRAVVEINLEITVKSGRPEMTIWRMRIACGIPKATNTHSQYVILIAFPLQKWLHEHASVLRDT